MKEKKENIEVQGFKISFVKETGFISLTDLARKSERDPTEVVRDWFRNSETLLFLQTWEVIHNPNFKVWEMTHFRLQVLDKTRSLGFQRYTQETLAIGLVSVSGRYGGTFAHPDIALHFCNWMNPEFYAYFLHEFQVMKEKQASLEGKHWDLRRELASSNFFIHTDAVRTNIVPLLDWNTKRESLYQASEADLLNLAVFGTIAKQWKALNPEAKGNLRDHASVRELRVLANMESINATLIEQGFTKDERLAILARRVERELAILEDVKALKKLE